MAISAYQRYCLNMQGYGGLSDDQKRQIDIAQRFKPALCAAAAIAAIATHSLPLTYVAVALGYWAALLPAHPADLFYRWVMKPVFRAPDLGADPAPRRFACGMAASLLLIGALGWQFEIEALGYAFVGLTAASLTALVFADFCMGSFFYWLMVRRRIFRGHA
jgi:hypothetical protein